MTPYALKSCLNDYIVEHLRPNGSDVRRPTFAVTNLCAFFGDDRDVNTLTKKDERNYRAARLADGASDSTIRREMGFAMAAFNFAADEERIAHVPAWKLPPESAARERWFTEDEMVKLMEQPMSDRARLFISIALGTGARREAITTLPVKRVDFVNGYIDFRDPKQAPVRAKRKRRVKTKMNDWLRPIMERACAGKKPNDLVIGEGSDPSRAVKVLLRKIGIEEKGIAGHAFRRTFTMWAFLNGAKLAEVSAATGDTMQTLEKSYMKLLPAHTAGAVNAINNPTGEKNA